MAANYSKLAPVEKSSKTAANDDLFTKLKGWYQLDVVKANKWRKEAVEDTKFRDGDQWNDEEKKKLIKQDRPVVVFNRTGVLVDAVVGSEIGNRREVRYIPREMGDAKPNELLTGAADWFRDLCDAEDEDSEAFKDTVTAGMGWTETRLDMENNPEGDPKVDQVNPLEMVWDCNALKANLVDAKRMWRVKKVPLSEAISLLPDADPDTLDAAWADPEGGEDTEPRHVDRGNFYGGEETDASDMDKLVTVVCCQYEQKESYYRTILINPDTQQPQQVDLDAKKFQIAKDAGAVIQSAKLTRKTVMQCWLGSTGVVKKPEPTQVGGFSWKCITGLKDSANGTWYGIVRRAKDPQRWANKFLSQMMFILNSQAKGGIMAEAGAFENVRDAEAKWTTPNAITILEDGALSGPNPKIQPKPMAQFPAGFDRLLQYADEMIIKATGINMELLGIREVNQPGVLEYQRKQSGMAILAPFFDSLKRYRKIQGRAMLHLIQNHLADGRLVKIVGDEQAQYVPLMKEQVANKDYDIIVDDAPSSTNEKEKTFQILMQLLPVFKDAIGPSQGMILAEYSPLPSSLVEKLKASVEQTQQEMAQQAQQAPPDPKVQTEQVKQQTEQMKQGFELQKQQGELQKMDKQALLDQMKYENEAAKLAHEGERMKSEETIALQQSNVESQKINQAQTATDTSNQSMEQVLAAIAQGQAMMGQAMQTMANAVDTMSKPRRSSLVKNPDGSRHAISEIMQ